MSASYSRWWKIVLIIIHSTGFIRQTYSTCWIELLLIITHLMRSLCKNISIRSLTISPGHLFVGCYTNCTPLIIRSHRQILTMLRGTGIDMLGLRGSKSTKNVVDIIASQFFYDAVSSAPSVAFCKIAIFSTTSVRMRSCARVIPARAPSAWSRSR